MEYEDKTITCDDCGEDFVHSVDDQQRYAERGFEHEPKRCRECREKRKAKSGGGGGGGERRSSFGGDGGGGGGGGGGDRESHEATCSECGAKTTVPFKPDPERPVFCRDCYRSRKRA